MKAAPFAGSIIEILPDTGFWRVTEQVCDPYQTIYDGVLVGSGDAAVVVLKDRLAGLASNYMLWPEYVLEPDVNPWLRGRGAATGFSASDNIPYKTTFVPISIRLIKRQAK